MRALLAVPAHTVTFLKVMSLVAAVLIAPHLPRAAQVAEVRHG